MGFDAEPSAVQLTAAGRLCRVRLDVLAQNVVFDVR